MDKAGIESKRLAIWAIDRLTDNRSLVQRHPSGSEETLSAGEFERLAHAIGGITMRVLDFQEAPADSLRTEELS